VVAGRVDARLEPGSDGALEEPGARREVRVGEGGPADAAARGGADRRERVEVGAEPILADRQRSGIFSSRPT
jgi:hypothetical protein